jgi:hypothetical protein
MEPTSEGLPRPGEHRAILRVGIAFLLAMPILAWSMIRKYPRLEDLQPLDALAWTICAVAVAWNAIEYGLGRAAYGQETPPWLRWVLAVPYFLVTWIGIGSISGMIAGIAFLAGELGYNKLP